MQRKVVRSRLETKTDHFNNTSNKILQSDIILKGSKVWYYSTGSLWFSGKLFYFHRIQLISLPRITTFDFYYVSSLEDVLKERFLLPFQQEMISFYPLHKLAAYRVDFKENKERNYCLLVCCCSCFFQFNGKSWKDFQYVFIFMTLFR